jgi:hypothetical protein
MRHPRWSVGWIALLALVAVAGWPVEGTAQGVAARCEDYASQDEAQRAFDRDPERFRDLDNDGDGIACEHLIGDPDASGSALPWFLGSALLIGLAAGAGVWMMRRRRSTPAALPAPSIAPEYDTGVEIELAALKAADDTAPSQRSDREPDASS